MNPGIVIGSVVATQKDKSLVGIKLLLVQPTDWQGNDDGDPLVAIDTVSAGAGEFIFYVSAREAAICVDCLPPVDAAIVGIIDGVELRETG